MVWVGEEKRLAERRFPLRSIIQPEHPDQSLAYLHRHQQRHARWKGTVPDGEWRWCVIKKDRLACLQRRNQGGVQILDLYLPQRMACGKQKPCYWQRVIQVLHH